MSFASLLEDLVDVQNELDHFARNASSGAANRPRPETSRVQEKFENPDFVDAQEVNRFYRSQLRLVKRFVDYYNQERQVLEQHRSGLPGHLAMVDQIAHALTSVVMLKDWDDDEARWNVVVGIEKQLNRLLRDRSIGNALSPQLLEHLRASAQHAHDQAIKLKRCLDDALLSPIDSRVSNEVRDDLTSCATLLDLALPSFEKDFSALTNALDQLQDLRDNWESFLELYQKLPLLLQRRLTIKELSRLNLHEDQEQYVALNHVGCFQLAGVSGSGKSIILVNRALRLASEMPTQMVHVVTINRSLATQLKGTLEVVGRSALPDNIKVGSLYDLFHNCISVCCPADTHRLFDDRSGERIEHSWRDFVTHKGRTAENNAFADKEVKSLLQSLEARLGGRGAAFEYLRDEVQCVQSAYLREERRLFLEEKRLGRSIRLLESQRQAVLKVVDAWEEWLDAGDLSDIHTVSLQAAELLAADNTRNEIRKQVRADVVLVDESQDLSTVELIALRHLLNEPDDKNALFLTGDVCQKVYSKHQALERAGYGQSQSTAVLRKNFRNTKQILTAAFRTIAAFSPPAAITQGSITKPEVSPYSGSKPLAVNCFGKSQEECIRDIVRCIAQERVAVVTENQTLLDSLLQTLNADPNVNCVHVQGNADIDRWHDIPASPTEIAVFLSSFDAVKGFEFDTVIVADVSQSRDAMDGDQYEGVPPVGMPEGDYWRCATKFYAACTRARNHLIVTYVGTPSVLLKNATQDFDWIHAEDRRLLDVIVGQSDRL